MRPVVPAAVGDAWIAADPLEMGLEQTRDIRRIHHGHGDRRGRWWRLVRRRRQGRDLGLLLGGPPGLILRFAFCRFDLLLRIGGRLLFRLFDLSGGVVGLFSRLGKLAFGFFDFALGLLGDVLTFLLEIALGLFGHLLLGLLGLARRLLFELPFEVVGFLPGLVFGLALDDVGSFAGLLGGVELVESRMRKIGVDAAAMGCEKRAPRFLGADLCREFIIPAGLCIGIDWRCDLRHQRHRFTTQ